MILRSIRISNFRKFRTEVVLRDLPDGLLVIAGDNEEGKSTVLAALRAAFFSKHGWSGKLVDSYQPHGSEVAPEVTVDFEIAGGRFRLEKRFCQRKFCRLVGAAGAWEGDAAEAELARMLGAEEPRRAPASGDETGLEGPLGLLWVKQGEAWMPRTSDSASAGLRGLLEAEVGGVLGGPRAQAILEKAAGLRQNLLTPTGNPTGEFKAAGERCSHLRSEERDFQGKAAAQEKQRVTFEQSKKRLRDLESQLPAFGERQSSADSASRQLADRQRRIDQLRQTQSAVEEKCGRLTAQLGQRQDASRRIKESQTQATDRQAALEAAQKELEISRDAAQRVTAQEQANETDLQKAEAASAALEAQAELLEEQASLADKESRLAAAKQARAERDRHLAEMQCLVDGAALRKLTAAWEELQRAEARAAHVEIVLEPSISAILDGLAIGPKESTIVARRTRLEIAANGQRLASVTIHPAALAGGALDVEACRQAWRDAAAPFTVGNLAEAQVQTEKRSGLENQVKLRANDIERAAPLGIARLESDIEVVRQKAETIRSRVPTIPVNANLPAALAAARASVGSARDALSRVHAKNIGAQKDLDHAGEKLQSARVEHVRVTDEVRVLTDELDRETAKLPNERLASDLEGAQRELASLATQIEPLDIQQRQSDPTRIASELTMATRALVELRRETDELRRQVDTFRGELSAAEPWTERLSAVVAELEFATQRNMELQRRAEAVKLLNRVLADARAQAETQFLGPVLERVAPLAELLLPGAQVHLNVNLEPEAIQRDHGGNAAGEDFDALSLGTREQLAILVRLAFAQLLRERGRAAVTILDDAPAFADSGRFSKMLGLLHQCAQGGQIIVLTCREHEFRPSGARVVRLSAAGETGYASTTG